MVPSRPGHSQSYDTLTAQNVRQGYAPTNLSFATSVESINLTFPLWQKLSGSVPSVSPGANRGPGGMAGRLERMAREVFFERTRPTLGIQQKTKRHEQISPTHTFKPPTRTIHTNLMRSNFLNALSNPAIPLPQLLSKTSSSIPHGIKGQAMLEEMKDRGVPVDRAVWMIRLIGGLEVGQAKKTVQSGSKLGLQKASDTYKRDFTRILTQWWLHHLTLILPSGNKQPALNDGASPCSIAPLELFGNSILTDPDPAGRNQWVEKWEYIVELSREMGQAEAVEGWETFQDIPSPIRVPAPPQQARQSSPSAGIFKPPAFGPVTMRKRRVAQYQPATLLDIDIIAQWFISQLSSSSRNCCKPIAGTVQPGNNEREERKHPELDFRKVLLPFILSLLGDQGGFARQIFSKSGRFQDGIDDETCRRFDQRRLIYGRRLVRACFDQLVSLEALDMDLSQGEVESSDSSQTMAGSLEIQHSLRRIINVAWEEDRIGLFFSPRTWRRYGHMVEKTLSLDPSDVKGLAELCHIKRRNERLLMRVDRPKQCVVPVIIPEGDDAGPASGSEPTLTRTRSSASGRSSESPTEPSTSLVSQSLDNISMKTDLLQARAAIFNVSMSTPQGKGSMGCFTVARLDATKTKLREIMDWMVRSCVVLDQTDRMSIDRTVYVGIAVMRGIMLDHLPESNPDVELGVREKIIADSILLWTEGIFADVQSQSASTLARSPLDVSVVRPLSHVMSRLVRAGLVDYEGYMGLVISTRAEFRDLLLQVLKELPYYGNDDRVLFQRRMLLYGSPPQRANVELQSEASLRERLTYYLEDGDLNMDEEAFRTGQSEWVISRAWHRGRLRSELRDWMNVQLQTYDGATLDMDRMNKCGRMIQLLQDDELLLLWARLIDKYGGYGPADARDVILIECVQRLQQRWFMWELLDLQSQATDTLQNLQAQLSALILKRSSALTPPQLETNTSIDWHVKIAELRWQPTLDAVDRLSDKLIHHFTKEPRMIERVWELALVALAELDVTLLQPESETRVVDAYARLLHNLGQHFPSHIDVSFRQWARSFLKRPALGKVNEQSCLLLLQLISRRVVRVRDVLEAFLLPLWRIMAASIATPGATVPDETKFILFLTRALFPTSNMASELGLRQHTTLQLRRSLTIEMALGLEDASLSTLVIRHLPFLAVITVERSDKPGAKSWRDRILQDVCDNGALFSCMMRQEETVQDAVFRTPFDWKGHEQAQELVQGHTRQMFRPPTLIQGQGATTSFVHDWHSLTNSVPSPEVKSRVRSCIQQTLVDLTVDCAVAMETWSVILDTLLSMESRKVLHGALAGLTCDQATNVSL